MVYLIIYFILFAVWITAELLIAPKGFEDNDGFHYTNLKEDKPKLYKPSKDIEKLSIARDKKGKISMQS